MKFYPKAVVSLESPIGPITLIAQGEKIVRVELGKKARAEGSSKVLTEAKKQLDAYFSGKLDRFNIPD
jgi:methylated-DNA-[protein]-cysteine S-methyltransferase